MATLLITGSNRGIGRGIASVFHRAGYSLVSLNRTLAGVPWLGEIPCDLADRDSLESALRCVQESAPTLDVCVLNAGIRRLARADSMSAKDFAESFWVNCGAAFMIAQRMRSAMARVGGTIVFVGSNAAVRAFEGGAAYCTSKAAMGTLADVLELEWGPSGVRVTLLVAGAVSNRPKGYDAFKLTPEEIGEVVLNIARLPNNVRVQTIAVEPMKSLAAPVEGIERLLYRRS